MPWIGRVLGNKYIFNLFKDAALSEEDREGRRVPDNLDLLNTNISKAQKAYLTSRKKLSQEIYAAVNKVAQNFYGQVFRVPLPMEFGGLGNNIRQIAESMKWESSWEISDSAWSSTMNIGDVSFVDGEGKLKSACFWPVDIARYIDYNALGDDWAMVGSNEVASLKGGPDKDIIWDGGTAYAIVRTGVQLREFDAITTPDFGLTVLAKYFLDMEIPPKKLYYHR